MNHLEKRMGILEQRVNRCRHLTLFLGLCLATVVLMGATDGDVQEFENIRAKKIELMGDDGNQLVVLSSHQGDGVFAVFTKEGDAVIGAGVDSGMVFFTVNSKEGKPIVDVMVGESGDGHLTVNSNEGKELICVGVDTSGDGSE